MFIKTLAICVILLFLCSCNSNLDTQKELTEYNTINFSEMTLESISWDRNKPQNLEFCTIYVLENSTYVPYLVIDSNFNGQTLLLRKFVLEEGVSVREDKGSFYDGGFADSFLETEFSDGLDDNLKAQICKSKIDISNYPNCKENLVIERKIFLLSAYDVGFINVNHSGEECLEFFEDSQNRLAKDAYNNGVSWWTRSSDDNYYNCTYAIDYTGKFVSLGSYEKLGLRPAFCVSGSSEIALRNDIIDGKEVYVFKLSNL